MAEFDWYGDGGPIGGYGENTGGGGDDSGGGESGSKPLRIYIPINSSNSAYGNCKYTSTELYDMVIKQGVDVQFYAQKISPDTTSNGQTFYGGTHTQGPLLVAYYRSNSVDGPETGRTTISIDNPYNSNLISITENGAYDNPM